MAKRVVRFIGMGFLASLISSLPAIAVLSWAGDKVCPLHIRGMSCEACAGKVEAALKSVPGVKEANVDYKSSLATVTMDDSVKPSKLIDAVKNVGFEATPIADKTGSGDSAR